jgi:glutamine synthetase
MELMRHVAERHNLAVLLDEKPFAGINGSGKHCNWSMQTNTGKNLFSPGANPQENLLFQTFFINLIKAIHDNADILRAAIANEGNDYRLGANEAPPAIISIFTGDAIEEIFDSVFLGAAPTAKGEARPLLNLGVKRLPITKPDSTDRNRTSPFPFTGNKFEFRAVGSSANVAWPVTILNTIVARQLREFYANVEARIQQGNTVEQSLKAELKEVYSASKTVVFNGDNYTAEWVEEAQRRGLPNAQNTPAALPALVTEKAINLFQDLDVLSGHEMHARYEVELEKYNKKLHIEAHLVEELALTYIVPSTVSYINELVQSYRGLLDMGIDNAANEMRSKALKLSENLSGMTENVNKMMASRAEAEGIEDLLERAKHYCNVVKPYFAQIRKYSDALELMVDDKLWQLPKYRELLFLR